MTLQDPDKAGCDDFVEGIHGQFKQPPGRHRQSDADQKNQGALNQPNQRARFNHASVNAPARSPKGFALRPQPSAIIVLALNQ
jgi:hypothetical protein